MNIRPEWLPEAYWNLLPLPLQTQWALWGIAAIALLLLGGLAFALRQMIFRRRVRQVAANPTLAASLIRQRYTDAALLRRSREIQQLAERVGPDMLAQTGIDRLWVERLRTGKSRGDMQRVLRFVPQLGLFTAFEVALARRGLRPILLNWLIGTRDPLYLRRLALSGAGRTFDGGAAREMLSSQIELVRELAGDPEWGSRFFAVQILQHDDHEKSRQVIVDALGDAHPLVRKTALTALRGLGREETYERLRPMALGDPAHEVRQEAWRRIRREFVDLHSLELHSLKDAEVRHALEQLMPGNTTDEAFAMRFLDSDDLERRVVAAEFLAKAGALKRLCMKVDMSDRDGLERQLALLQKAAEVNVYGYLAEVIDEAANQATVYLCARLLPADGGLADKTTALLNKAFSLYDRTSTGLEVCAAVLDAASQQGSESALRRIGQELSSTRDDESLLSMLLEHLPSRGARLFMGPLMQLFRNPDAPIRDKVREAMKRMPPGLILNTLLELLQSPREQVAFRVRVDAVRVLGELGLPYCLETVLENLWNVPAEEARGFMEVLTAYPAKLLKDKVDLLLGTNDSRIRAAVIDALPATGDTRYVPKLEALLSDVDPDVRIAVIWALTRLEGFDWDAKGVELLRDPVDRVRAEAAKALGTVGHAALIKALGKSLDDKEEGLSVRLSAVEGLGAANSGEAMDVLVRRLEPTGELREAILKALTQATRPVPLARLFEHFKDAEPRLREDLTVVFKAMGEVGGQGMAALLEEDIASLRPYVLDVMESTGQIDYQIRRLSHRDPITRRNAAEFLSNVNTLSALRGLVLAAKDPDEAVRVLVVKALERLQGGDGQSLLESLRKDPSRKVRNYTLWAQERLKARQI